MSYQEIIEAVKALSVSEKEELKAILEKLLLEARREEILQHYLASKEEERRGELTFYSDPQALRESLQK
ncbi:MAG TPA: hypothetical protein VNL36_10835 [Bacteroidota bacterium]|nr:hypothetical protein [Bacteroidota bacterium]